MLGLSMSRPASATLAGRGRELSGGAIGGPLRALAQLALDGFDIEEESSRSDPDAGNLASGGGFAQFLRRNAEARGHRPKRQQVPFGRVTHADTFGPHGAAQYGANMAPFRLLQEVAGPVPCVPDHEPAPLEPADHLLRAIRGDERQLR